MSDDSARRILGAIEHLKAGERAAAAELLQEELRLGPPAGERWQSVQRLAGQIGEIEIAIEAARRYSRTPPATLDRLLYYWGELAAYDRVEEARRELESLPLDVREQPNVLHFFGTLASQMGEFAEAEELYRRAIEETPDLPQTWFALAMLKTFTRGDPDMAAMQRLLPKMQHADPSLQARLLYGVAKAHHDCGDYDRAWELYAQGADLRRRQDPRSLEKAEIFAQRLIREFTAHAAKKLRPVRGEQKPSLFVNGLPRSGTTLIEQILVSHSQVAAGGEVNLLQAALIPTGDRSLDGALRYQAGFDGGDPWGTLAADYFRMLEMRFRTSGLVVDKTLGQSYFMGLLLHILPGARVIWLRRNPDDVALSCFRNFFTARLAWSWSLTDIADYMKIEDRLFEHWTGLFPERILVVPYESMVSDPKLWIPRILEHAGLDDEPAVHDYHKNARHVRTASVRQVREPISTARIGLAGSYRNHLAHFRERYYD